MNVYVRYLLRKFGWYILTFFIAVTLNFILPRLIEGNPIAMIVATMAQGMTDTDRQKRLFESYMQQFGLDRPLYEQYFIYLRNLFRGELGVSFGMFPRTVENIIATSAPWTIGLQLPAIITAWIVGNVLGALAAFKRGLFDKIVFPAMLLANAVPFFAMSILLLYLFALNLDWFPIGGGFSPRLMPHLSLTFIGSVLRHHTLPFLSLVFVMLGGWAIGMRSMAIYELNTDYVLYSKLMGIRESKIIRYVFKNAMLPQITGLAISLGTMVGGALITEIVFNYPGIGMRLFTAIRTLDYPLISGITLMIITGVLIANFLVEIVYGLVDPRIKSAQLEE